MRMSESLRFVSDELQLMAMGFIKSGA